jgi:hypothetical protein
MAGLFCWANILKPVDPWISEAPLLLEKEDSALGRIIRRTKTPG